VDSQEKEIEVEIRFTFRVKTGPKSHKRFLSAARARRFVEKTGSTPVLSDPINRLRSPNGGKAKWETATLFDVPVRR